MTDELRGVRIRPFQVDQDLGWLYELIDLPANRDQWHHHGRRFSFEAFSHQFDWVGDGHLVSESRSGEPLGYHQCYSLDTVNGHAAIAVVYGACPPVQRGLGIDLFLHYVFRVHPVRKLYAEVIDFNMDAIGSAVHGLFVEEGRLRDHVFCRGAYRDVVHLSLSRQAYASASLIGGT